MKPQLTAQNLNGNWGTLLLPINNDDTINYQILADEIDYLVAAGINGIYSNGTAGELHNQTEAEFDKVQHLLAEKCNAASMPFQIGVSNPSPLVSLQRLQRCCSLKPDAFQIILPDWVTVKKEEQILFLQKMAEAAAGIPLVLYNPPHAKLVLQPEDYANFKTVIPALIGIKVGIGDARWYEQMSIYASHLAVFVPGHLLASGVQQGVARGAYSNVACISPKGAQWWWQLMQHNIDEALRIEEKINAFFKACIVPYQNSGYSNPALDKFLAAIGGWCPVGTRLRWPYKWIPQNDIQAARAAANQFIPELMTFNEP